MRYFRVYSYFAYCPNVLIVMCFFPVVFSLNIVVYVAFSHCVSLISFSLDQFLSLFFFFFWLSSQWYIWKVHVFCGFSQCRFVFCFLLIILDYAFIFWSGILLIISSIVYFLVHHSMKHMMSPDPIIGDVNLDHLVKMITIRFIHYKDF